MLSRIVTFGLVGLAGCATPPVELQREPRLDVECRSGTVAFVYSIQSNIVRSAVGAGCYAPLGAWTDGRDLRAGGVRKLVYELREKDGVTLLCCPS